MSAAQLEELKQHLAPGEQIVAVIASTQDMSGAELAMVGVAGAALGVAGSLAANSAAKSRRKQPTSRIDIQGVVALTNRRLLALDERRGLISIDRSQVQSVELSRSNGGAWMQRLDLDVGGETVRIHGRFKRIRVFSDHLRQDGVRRVDDPLALVKAAPVILLLMVGTFVVIGSWASKDWVALPIGLLMLAFGVWLRRRFFPRKDASGRSRRM